MTPYHCERCGHTIYIETYREIRAHDKAHDLGYTFEAIKEKCYDEIFGWQEHLLIKAMPPKTEESEKEQ